MEAKRRPRNVWNKLNQQHVIFQEHGGYLVVMQMFLKVRTPNLKRLIVRKRSNIRQELPERGVRQARRNKKDSKEGKKSRSSTGSSRKKDKKKNK